MTTRRGRGAVKLEKKSRAVKVAGRPTERGPKCPWQSGCGGLTPESCGMCPWYGDE